MKIQYPITRSTKTYGDVFLTDTGLARTSDGRVFSGKSVTANKKLVVGVGINNFETPVRSAYLGNWKPYMLWADIIKRVHNKKFLQEQPTYVGTSVAPEWLLFSNFLLWLMQQPYHFEDFEVDKDLIGRGKFYGPEDCVMVPQWVNKILSHVGTNPDGFSAGVTKANDKFQVRVRTVFGVSFKTFSTIEEAIDGYYNLKFSYIEEIKESLDNIDERLYTSICAELNRRRLRSHPAC